MDTLNLVGAGKVARVLGRLWHESGQFRIADVLTRSRRTAADAAAFMGAGRPCSSLSELGPARFWMVGVNDDEVAAVARRLADLRCVSAGDVVFHLSGALMAEALIPLRAMKADIASLHPLKSIPDAETAYHSFAGTPVALEGDASACERLVGHCEAIGGATFRLDSVQKVHYHAANCILGNYLTALLDAGLEVYERAGIDPARAVAMVAPLMRESLDYGLRLGPAASLTGPIARGDSDSVTAHLKALPDSLKGLYRELGRRALRIAIESGRLSADRGEAIEKLLDPNRDNATAR